MARVYRIRNSDRREEYIKAFDDNAEFITQKISGSDVEFFDPSIGFGLIESKIDMPFYVSSGQNKGAPITRPWRVRSIAQLTLEAPRALREVYYALRNRKKLLPAFSTTNNLYEAVLQSIIHTEVACDVERQMFAVGNRPSGSIYYGHHVGTTDMPAMSNPERIVGFTENIARALRPSEVEHAMSIVHVEKNTMAGRLHTMKYSKLTNSLITTAGGNYTRAVFALAGRFIGKIPMIHCCDADVFGVDMLRTTRFGSMNSRHITLDQAFPPERFPNMHFSGFYPSIGEHLGLPNDLGAKRPQNNEAVMKRIQFLERYGLADERDLATWYRNNTYELEALSESVTNPGNEPIGLGVYLTEYMRLKGIPCKPQPPIDNDELMDDFKQYADRQLRQLIESQVNKSNPRDDIWNVAWKILSKLVNKVYREAYENLKEALDEIIDECDPEVIRSKLLLQYDDNPYREVFNMNEVVEELFQKLKIDIDWSAEEMLEGVEKALEEYAEDRELEYDGETEFEPVDYEEREPRDFYDVVEEEIGADPDDCATMREALEWRLG